MAIPGLVPSLITGGSNILDVGINAILQQKTNKENRRYATYMYDRQRADALADWNAQNEYNSPNAQMARLKAAGLNPNLVYGQGVSGNSANPVRSSSAPSYKGEAPRSDIGSAAGAAVGTYYDVKMKQMQMDLIQTQIENIQHKTVGIDVDNLLKGSRTKQTDEMAKQLAIKNSILAQYGMTTADWNVRKTQSDVTKNYTQVGLMEAQRILTTDENGRRERLTEANINAKLVTMALQQAQMMLAQTNQQLTNEKRALISQQVQNSLKTGEGQKLKNDLLQSELDYQKWQRLQSWLGTVTGAAGKFK